MSEYSQTSPRILFKLGLAILVVLLLLARIGYSQNQVEHRTEAILQGSIHIQASKPVDPNSSQKVQPGTTVQLSVIVDNKGTQISPQGEIYLKYGFAKPLDNEIQSLIFQTEKLPLPTIEPGKNVTVSFTTPHQWPSILDFIRNDWSLREYQAIAIIDGEEHVIGSLAVTFSAYYYPGMRKEFPIKIAVPIGASAAR
jgi:hypothetical protein